MIFFFLFIFVLQNPKCPTQEYYCWAIVSWLVLCGWMLDCLVSVVVVVVHWSHVVLQIFIYFQHLLWHIDYYYYCVAYYGFFCSFHCPHTWRSLVCYVYYVYCCCCCCFFFFFFQLIVETCHLFFARERERERETERDYIDIHTCVCVN